jgi:hypothetical protein
MVYSFDTLFCLQFLGLDGDGNIISQNFLCASADRSQLLPPTDYPARWLPLG